MPNSVFFLIVAAIGVLALIDVGLGHYRPGPFAGQGKTVRLGLREFATGPVPIFLFGVGTAMLPDRTAVGTALLLVAALLALLGRRARRG
jgi:hypothetical protein